MNIKIEKEDLEKLVNKLANNITYKASMNKKSYYIFCLILTTILSFNNTFAQETEPTKTSDNVFILDYKKPQTFTIEAVEIIGTTYLDKNIIRSLSGLKVGSTITVPGDDISKAIKSLWKQGLFGDIQVQASKIVGDKIYLDIVVEEKPRLNTITILGIKKGEKEDIAKKLDALRAKPITEALKANIKSIVADFYEEKSYLYPIVDVVESKDSGLINSNSVIVNIDKGPKVTINSVHIDGRENVEVAKIRKIMKNTKESTKIDLGYDANPQYSKKQKIKNTLYTLSNLNFASVKDFLADRFRITFKGNKYNEEKYEQDKINLINYYNTLGYRDAKIISDTVINNKLGTVDINIKIEEGHKYYFGDITFKGNSKYSDEVLHKQLGIKKGDIYNLEQLQKRINGDMENGDISSLYYDDGYLFFNINPVEVAVRNNDTIDIELRVYEGAQATIKNIIIEGNDKTNEHVIRRELRTIPGDKFSRSNLIRSQRELANLGFIDPQETQVVPIPNPSDGTVDIKYTIKEKSADQIELSAGWGGQSGGLIGTLGLRFNNFSLRNMFRKGTWSPLPTGDGQQFALRVETNGKRYQNYNFSFTEPWLGGKKPNAFTFAAFRSRLQDVLNKQVLGNQITNGLSVSIGTRLKKPDDYFIFQASADYYGYSLNNFGGRYYVNGNPLTDGKFNNLNFKLALSRNSVNNPTFPTSGSNVSMSVQFTPPYSLFRGKDVDYSEQTDAQKFKWLEYHKWRINMEWYTPISKSPTKPLVLKLAAKFGYLGAYNKNIGVTPFERFQLGGNGIPNNVTLFGTTILAQRGYEGPYSNEGGDPIFNKFLLELRYPFSLNPTATVYGVLFAEAANTYQSIKDYNPFKLKKSVGVGIRAILPMFGLIGIDYGVRFDNANGSSFNSTSGFFDYIGKNGNITFILGFEPE
jgi:outer membrane protein insertion porin family